MWPTTTKIPTEPAGYHGASSYTANDEFSGADEIEYILLIIGLSDDAADYVLRDYRRGTWEYARSTERTEGVAKRKRPRRRECVCVCGCVCVTVYPLYLP